MTSETPTRPELGNVIVGIDGSPSGRTAVLWAADEAHRRGRALHLVHAADSDRRTVFADTETIQAVREAGRDLLTETASAVRGLFPDLAVTKELSCQEPVAGLRAAAGHRGTIVVGNRGLGGFSGLMLGSVGLGVVGRAEVPVVVIRGDGERPASGSVTAAVHGASDLGWLLGWTLRREGTAHTSAQGRMTWTSARWDRRRRLSTPRPRGPHCRGVSDGRQAAIRFPGGRASIG
ncbi:universal stress protein [Streptomyces sp. NPDC005951]|uniref:universal stress protein n=1 Tax=Streptomyces sp. NPDC005951 TaxID=3154573 RepID=UPI0033F95E65